MKNESPMKQKGLQLNKTVFDETKEFPVKGKSLRETKGSPVRYNERVFNDTKMSPMK